VAEGDAGRFQLRHVVDVFRRRKVTLAAVTIGVTVFAALFSLLQTRTYQASAEILIEPRATESVFDTQQPSNPTTANVETEVRVLRSDPVRQAVRQALGSIPPVAAGRIGETDVMRVSATSSDARRAARIANAYATSYVEFRKSQAVGDLASASKSIQAKIKDLQSQIDALQHQMSQSSSSQAVITPQYNALITQQGLLAQKLDSLQVDANLKSGGAQLVRDAAVPSSPASPKPLRNTAIGFVVGLIVGTGVIFLQEHLDDTVKSKGDLAEALPGTAVLGMLPVVQGADWETTSSRVQSLRVGNTAAAEAYRDLRTSVQLLGVEAPLRTLQVTSPAASEGKTTLVANLGVVMAVPGQRVVMVDCDLRRPALHTMFDLPNERGFTSVFQGGASALDAVVPVAAADSLFVLPSGPLPPNPSELLASRRTAELLFELQSEFDVVLVDSAPVLPVTDAIVLAAWVEATVLVARAGVSTGKLLTESMQRLSTVEARVAGTVLNAAEASEGYGYAGYYTDTGVHARGRSH